VPAAGLKSRLQEARWFVKNILQRFDTIQRVSQAIVERQKSFFTHGAIAMKPLVCARSPTSSACTNRRSRA
jgi:RNA polymerase sigma-54 factor